MKGDCGHDGEFVIGRFFLCSSRNCDGKARPERCRQCQSADLYEFISPLVPPGTKACKPCGHLWWNQGVFGVRE